MRPICCSPTLVLGLTVGVCLAIGATAAPALAGEVPGVDLAADVIPYDGLLELDGVPVNGNHRLRFTLFESPDQPSATWDDTFTVEVVNGRFTVLLGSAKPLQDLLVDSDVLYLGIEVEDPDTEDAFFRLANHQRIVPAPYAYVAVEAPEFEVNETLTVHEGATIDGGLTVAGPASFAGLSAQSMNADEMTVTGASTTSTLTVNDTLGAVNATIDQLAVSGEITGSLTVSGAIAMTCPATMTRVGGFCIDNLTRPAQLWDVALRDCWDEGLQMCPLQALLACDLLNASASQCHAETDSGVEGRWIWTPHTRADDQNAFTGVGVQIFASNGNHASNEIDYTNASGGRHIYFCCGGPALH